MDFGNFDDDLFAKERPKIKKTPQSDYKPRDITPQWFLDEQAPVRDDPAEQMQLFIHRGDHHYYLGAWGAAGDAYARALEHVASNNPTMRRLLLECLARCQHWDGDHKVAVETGKRLLAESTSEDQLFGAHSLLSLLCQAAGDDTGVINSLKFCLTVRPSSVQHQIRLAKAYLRLASSADRCQLPSNHAKVLPLEQQRNLVMNGLEPACKTLTNTKDTYGPQAACDQQNMNAVVDGASSTCAPLRHQSPSTGQPASPEMKKSSPKHTYCHGNPSGNDIQERMQKVPMGCNHALTPAVNSNASHSKPADGPAHGTVPGSVKLEALADAASGGAGGCSLPDSESVAIATIQSLSLKDEGGTERCPPWVESGERSLSLEDGGTSKRLILEAAACLVRAQLLLKSVQSIAISFAKKRNSELLAEVEQLLDSLPLDRCVLQEICDQTAESLPGKGAYK
ncbi:uncharacterized protein [Diadema antillarum]|uniref:uncharacterized protein n=1 Tax=Diadema antillarum TaxID=105358 RepID=UPI003A8A3CF9